VESSAIVLNVPKIAADVWERRMAAEFMRLPVGQEARNAAANPEADLAL
jgi:hypothetical protein